MYLGLHIKYLLFLSDVNGTSIFSKRTQILNFLKLRPVKSEFFHTDGQTDRAKVIVALSNFACARKNRT